MDTNKIIKNALWGASALIGILVAEGTYKAGINAMSKRELIDDEMVNDSIIEDISEDNLPF